MIKLILLIVSLVLTLFHAKAQNIIIYGDSRTNHVEHKKVVSAILSSKPCAVFHTGDLVTNGWSKKEWSIFNEITKELQKQAVFYPAAGNHELRSKSLCEGFDIENKKVFYSADIQNIHLIVLNSNLNTGKYSGQYRWLTNDLENMTEKTQFLIAVFHHPVYSSGVHKPDQSNMSKHIIPLLKKYGLDIVFSGHDHCYERSFADGVYFITAGGGGAPLYGKMRENSYSQVYLKRYHFCKIHKEENELLIETISDDLQLIDSFSIQSK